MVWSVRGLDIALLVWACDCSIWAFLGIGEPYAELAWPWDGLP